MERGEPGVASGDAVLTGGFQEGEEAADPIGGDVGNLQRFDRPPTVGGGKLQKQDQGVAIALDRMAAHAAQRREVFLEKADDGSAKSGWGTGLHAGTSWTTSPKAASKRSLASWRMAGKKCR